MKLLVVLAAVCACAWSQTTQDYHNLSGEQLEALVRETVQKITRETPTLTIDQCFDKCVALFVFDEDVTHVIDEDVTHVYCKVECVKAIRAHLVQTEVNELLLAEPSMTVEQCTNACDQLFALSGGHDEETSDMLCQSRCAADACKNDWD
ncbi:hypothetical protein BaRGS_00015074 [Batillaria attramentaria]|uniref:Uncharacterized protein n=1 Tax=Batillaria attramentaria TaxID=370345 RepID=A0ABD0L2N9_9CAEN